VPQAQSAAVASTSKAPPVAPRAKKPLSEASASESPISAADNDTEDGFKVVVRRKRKVKRNRTKNVSDSEETDVEQRKSIKEQRKDKLEKLKEVVPPRTFIVKVGDKDANGVK